MTYHHKALALKRAAPYLPPTLLYGGMAIWITWPLALRLGDSILGWPGDNLYYAWLIGWFQKTLFQAGSNPFIVPIHNYPYGWQLAYTEITLSNVLLALPFSRIAGPLAGYNVVLLLSFVLSGVFMYAWVARLVGSRLGGLIAGALFAFAPYRLAHVYGHWPLMGTQYLAVYFAGLLGILSAGGQVGQSGQVENLTYEENSSCSQHRQTRLQWQYQLRDQRSRLQNWTVWAAGLGLGFCALSSMYYLYMTLVISAVIVVGYVLLVDRRLLTRLVFWKQALAAALISLPLLALALFPYLQVEPNHRPLSSAELYSANPTDFFVPFPAHLLLGRWTASYFSPSLWIEQSLYLGIVGLGLAALALWKRRDEPPGQAQVFNVILLGALASMILALGLHLHWRGEIVRLDVANYLPAGWIKGKLSIPLPNYLLFKYLPFYDGMRAWTRYGIYANLFISVLAGCGAARMERWLKRISEQPHATFSGLTRAKVLSAAAGVLLLVMILVDFYPGNMPLTTVTPRPLDQWLAAQPGDGAYVQFPINRSLDPAAIYGTLTSRKPTLGMFAGAYLPRSFRREWGALRRFPSQESVDVLRQRGIRYAVVEAGEYEDWPSVVQQFARLGLHEIAIVDGQYIFELQPQP